MLSIVSPFFQLTGGRVLLNELIHANPLAVAAALLVLLGALLIPLGRWSSVWRWDPDQPEDSFSERAFPLAIAES